MRSKRKVPMSVGVCIVVILFLVPFYILLINSFKSNSELMTDVIGWPKEFLLDNYKKALAELDYVRVFGNSIFVTVMSNVFITIIASMAAYRLERFPTRFNRFWRTAFLAGLIIPFQVVMIPMVKVLSAVHLTNSLWGVVLAYCGLAMPFTVFLIRGFVASVPKEMEEAAVLDGCTQLSMFWRIVFPLLKAIIFTGATINTFWFWNDFLLPQLILSAKEKQTIPIAVNAFFGQYVMKWDLALPALVIAVVPAVMLFLFFQRYLVEGITSGAVKG